MLPEALSLLMKNLLPQRVAWVTSHILKFWDPLYKFSTVKDRNFVFGAHIEYNTY